MFTNEFWTKEGFNLEMASGLVDRMRQAANFAHAAGAVMVDANELNWMSTAGDRPEPRVIDVDSWAIGKWPASVIMPSIRDWNAKTFDTGTDWFSWAIVSFQIYTGLHPYKGTLDGFDRGDLVGRMKARASVFSTGVRVNRAVRDFASIPFALRSWYEAVFQGLERDPPPSPYDKAISAAPAATVARMVVTPSAETLVYEKLFSGPGAAVRVFHCGIVYTNRSSFYDLGKPAREPMSVTGKDTEIVRVDGGWLIGELYGGTARFGYSTQNGRYDQLSLKVATGRLISYENRMFAVTERGLTEIQLRMLGGMVSGSPKPVASPGQTWGVMVNSTNWFGGFGVQDALGAMFLILPFGADSVAQVRVPELDGRRVVSGKDGNRFVSLVALDSNGDYVKMELTFSADYTTHKLWSGVTDSADLNIAILPKGVCATIVKDGELDIFVPTSGVVKKLADKDISTDMALANWGDTVVLIRNGEVWSVKVK